MSLPLTKRIGKTMWKVLSLWAIVAFSFVYACGQIPDAPDAESTVTITAPDGYSVNCASIYTRVAPHICSKNAGGSIVLTLDSTCRFADLSTLSVPTNSKAADLQMRLDVVSTNVVGPKNVYASFYTDSGCSIPAFPSQVELYVQEQVAIVAATRLVKSDQFLRVPLANAGFWYFGNATTASTMLIIHVSYFD